MSDKIPNETKQTEAVQPTSSWTILDPDAHPEKTPSETIPNETKQTEAVQPTCGWSVFSIILGTLSLTLALIGIFIWGAGSYGDRETGKWLLIAGLSSGLSCLLMAYVIQLLFECRNYLRMLNEQNRSLSHSERPVK